MRKAADLKLNIRRSLTPSTKRVKPQKVIAEQAGCFEEGCIEAYSWTGGRGRWKGKV